VSTRFVLSDYLNEAIKLATYKELDDGSHAGRIPGCPGVLAFGETRAQCQDELRSTLEEWVLLGLKLGHTLPVIAGIDLNGEPLREPVDSL
jgi:predicted RNase H-like HicB family nuclease